MMGLLAALCLLCTASVAPDGHTLGAASFAFAANFAVLRNLPFDPLKDFTRLK
jgi:hypothetical protein